MIEMLGGASANEDASMIRLERPDKTTQVIPER